jgi:hypothetical protein
VVPRAGLDTEARGKTLLPLPGIEPRLPPQPDTVLTELPWLQIITYRTTIKLVFVWVWSLVSHIKRRTLIEGI